MRLFEPVRFDWFVNLVNLVCLLMWGRSCWWCSCSRSRWCSLWDCPSRSRHPNQKMPSEHKSLLRDGQCQSSASSPGETPSVLPQLRRSKLQIWLVQMYGPFVCTVQLFIDPTIQNWMVQYYAVVPRLASDLNCTDQSDLKQSPTNLRFRSYQ